MLKSPTWNGLEKKALAMDVAVKLKLGNWENNAKFNWYMWKISAVLRSS